MNKNSNITIIIAAIIMVVGLLIASHVIADAIVYLADVLGEKLG